MIIRMVHKSMTDEKCIENLRQMRKDKQLRPMLLTVKEYKKLLNKDKK